MSKAERALSQDEGRAYGRNVRPREGIYLLSLVDKRSKTVAWAYHVSRT